MPLLQAFSEGSRCPLAPQSPPSPREGVGRKAPQACGRGRKRRASPGTSWSSRVAGNRRRSHRTRPSGRHAANRGSSTMTDGPRAVQFASTRASGHRVRSTCDGRGAGIAWSALRVQRRWSSRVARAVRSMRPKTRWSRPAPRRSARPVRRTARPGAGSSTGASHGAQFTVSRSSSQPDGVRTPPGSSPMTKFQAFRKATWCGSGAQPNPPWIGSELVIQEVEERDRAIPERIGRVVALDDGADLAEGDRAEVDLRGCALDRDRGRPVGAGSACRCCSPQVSS